MCEPRKICVSSVDALFEITDIVVGNHRRRRACCATRGGEPGADHEQSILDRGEHFPQLRIAALRTHQAELGIEFVDVAVGLDAKSVLRNALASDQRRFAFVSGASIDFHGRVWLVLQCREMDIESQRRSVAFPRRRAYLLCMTAWRRNLYILWGTQFLAMVGMNLVVPFLPFYIRTLGVTDPDDLSRWSGIVFAGPFFLAIIATPFWGSLGDRHGRKAMVVRALFGLALSQVFLGLAQNVYQLLLFRMFQGAVSGFIASALALISMNTPKENIGYALGFIQSSSAGGMVLGPFFGGFLADLVGYREIFFLTAFLCAIGGIVVAVAVHEEFTPGRGGTARAVFDNFALMVTDRRLRVVALMLVVAQMSVLMIEPIFALYIESFEASTRYMSTVAGAIFSVMGLFMVISAPWWGHRNDRYGYTKNLAAALVVVGIAYAGHIIVTDLYQLAVLRAFLGFARGGVIPSLYGLTNVYAPPDRRGGMIAVASSMTILGNLLGPISGGFIAARFGIAASFVATSILLVIGGITVARALPGRVDAAPAA